MIFIQNKTKGIILVIVGFYLLVVNTILSILFGSVYVPCIPTPNGYECPPVDPLTYFGNWLYQYGLVTILIALGGLALIIYGSRHFLIKKEFDDTKASSI